MAKVFSFIKSNFEGILIAAMVISFLSEVYFFDHNDLLVTKILGFLFVLFYSKRRPYVVEGKAERIKKLKAKGLTPQDIINIEFVKKWGETRNSGVWNYCITDGAFITGFVLLIPVSLLYFTLSHKSMAELLPDPGKMFEFIAYSYLTGAVIGVINCRIRWIINERRFLRLTDPLNTIFTGKKESFSDLI